MTETSVEKVSFLGKVLEETNGDMLRGLLLKMLEQVMESEANAACGASYGTRDGGRVNQRNGYRDRAFAAVTDSIDLEARRNTGFTFVGLPASHHRCASVGLLGSLGVPHERLRSLKSATAARPAWELWTCRFRSSGREAVSRRSWRRVGVGSRRS